MFRKVVWVSLVVMLSGVFGSFLGDNEAHAGYEPSILHYDEDGRLVYHSDEEGNRIMDFSWAGYRNGEADLPDLSAVHTIAPEPGDNRARLQDAIDMVESLPLDANGHRGALLLLPGVYEVSGPLHISRSGVVVRGSGDGDNPATDTIIYATGSSHDPVLTLGNEGQNGWHDRVSGTTQDIMSNFIPAGSRTFKVADASVYNVGDNIVIRHPSTDEWLSEVNYGNTAGDVLWNPGEIDLYFNRYITGIEGNMIEVDVPIYHDLDRSLSQSFSYVHNRSKLITESGIENLRIDIKDPDPYTNNRPAAGVKMIGVEDCWLENVTVLHYDRKAFFVTVASRSTILDCKALDGVGPISGGRLYAFSAEAFTNNILFNNCTASYARHSFITNGASTNAGIVFTQSYSTRDYSASEAHRRWGSAVLWDDITFANSNTNRVLGIGYNRGNWGTGHGWTGTGHVGWNVTGNHIVVQKAMIGQNYAIGCHGTVNNLGPWVFPIGHVEGTGQNLAIPSLYEAQLYERLTYGVGPDAPGRLTASHYMFTDESKYVDLEWIDVALDEDMYVLERSADGGQTFEVIAELDSGTESYKDTDIVQDRYIYRLKAVNEVGPSAYSNLLDVDLTVRIRPPAKTIQAEYFTDAYDCSVARNHVGYTSLGFVDMGVAGAWFEFDDVHSSIDNVYTMIIRYASSNNRPSQISVNGADVGEVSFDATGGWTSWEEDTIDIRLNRGMNTLRITSGSNRGPNIDKIVLIPGAGSADFVCDGIVDIQDLQYMSDVWLTDYYMADIAQPGDGIVNLRDMAVLAGQWMWDTGLPDTTPPTPEIASFEVEPMAFGPGSITMKATESFDDRGPVEYYFAETTGNPGGTDSGWISSREYTDNGLEPNTNYTYTVTVRDLAGNENTTSDPASATTWAGTTTTIVWNPAGNGIYPPDTGDWSDADNWTGTDPGRPNGNFKCVFNKDAAEAVVSSTTAINQFAIGDGGATVGNYVRIVDGGSLLAAGAVWSAIGYNRDATLEIEAGGRLETNDRVLLGRESESHLIVDGTVTIGGHLQIGNGGGFGFLTVDNGGLVDIDGNLILNGDMLIDVHDGTIIIEGNRIGNVNDWISDGQLIAYDGEGTVEVDYDTTNPGKTTIKATSGQ